MTRRRERMRLCSALVLASSAACGTKPVLETTPAPKFAQRAAQAPTQPTGPTDPSKPLEGRWQVVLTLDPLSMHNPPAAERVTGELAFGTGAWWGSADRFGRHSVDLRPFFGRMLAGPDGVTPFSAADTSMVTEVSGSITGDSVGIDFIPRIDHIGISFWGRFYGDSATGSWRRRGMEGSGRFWIRRVSKDPVNVAAIPVYTKISPPPVAVAATTPAPKDSVKTKGARGKSAKTAATKAAATKAAAAQAVATKAAATQAAATKGAATNATPTKVASSTAAPATTPAPAAGAPGASVPNANLGAGGVPNVTTPATGAPGPKAAAAEASPAPVKSSPTSSIAKSSPTTTVAASSPASSTPAPAQARNLTTNISNPPAPTAAADPKAMGTIRVRTFDKASNRYFATKYSLHLPDGRWMYGTLRTGADGEGWGAALPRMPGHYELEITDFMCGDKIWFLKDKIAKSIDVQPGQPADVTIELDLANVPARRSLDNPTGAKCAEGPGAVK
ncbi:MAG TPA: hypothetical protein VHM30_09755 [Gemmatimonadaceae bacterium]|nr:hypothetical protein [Gemmatimonadaceae bacterium]